MGKSSRKMIKNPFLRYVFAENRVFLLYAVFCFSALTLYLTYSAIVGSGFYRFSLFKLCDDTFMDFYNSVRDAHMLDIRCYTERHVIYPPLANLFYAFISRFMTENFVVQDDFHSLYWTRNLSNIFTFAFMTSVIIAVIAILINNKTDGSSSRKFVFAILSIISWPFAYMVERGNILILAYLFLLIYVFYYDSENKVKRELALISLALSAGLKLYPAVFGILLLLDKRYKDAVRTVIYGILSVMLPMFLFYDGINGLRAWISNIRRFTGMVSDSIYFPGSTTCKSGFYMIQRIFTSSELGIEGAGDKILTYFPLLIAIAAVLILPKKWQKLLGLVFFAITVPGGGGSYSMVFLTIPLIFMMKDKKLRVFDYLYALIITFQHMIFPIPMVAAQSIIGVNQAVTSLVVLMIFMVMLLDLCGEIIKIYKKQRTVFQFLEPKL